MSLISQNGFLDKGWFELATVSWMGSPKVLEAPGYQEQNIDALQGSIAFFSASKGSIS